MTDPLDLLRNIGESQLKPNCNISYKEPLIDRIRGINPRRTLGRLILGKPLRGQGVLMQVDLSHKTKEQVDAFWKAQKLLTTAGIRFDTGMGCNYDMELDWSLRGAVVICKKCGYNSEEHKEQSDIHRIKTHFIRPCDECGKELNSNDGHWHIKPHFWNKTKFYHTECYNQNSNEQLMEDDESV